MGTKIRLKNTPHNKLLGLIFLSLVLVAGAFVVNSDKFNFNPNEDASTCSIDCASNSDCGAGYYCHTTTQNGEITCATCKLTSTAKPTTAPSTYPSGAPKTCAQNGGNCYANGCDSISRKKVEGSCFLSGYHCCGAKLPIPTPIPCTSCTTEGNKRCLNTTIVQKCVNKCWVTDLDCATINSFCSKTTSGAICIAQSTPTPTPTGTPPPYKVYKTTSGTCAQKCVQMTGSCVSVGTDDYGNNGKIMSWGKWTSCVTRTANCNSTIQKIDSGVRCSNELPEWTNCRCKMNPYVN